MNALNKCVHGSCALSTASIPSNISGFGGRAKAEKKRENVPPKALELPT